MVAQRQCEIYHIQSTPFYRVPVRVADFIAEYLEGCGVRAAFMLSGGMMMHLMDAVSRRPLIRYYCNHHEQASAMAADAWARLTGQLALCMATSGPGATNLLTGIVCAWQDSSPVIFLTGQCKVAETVQGCGIPGLRQAGVFDVDIVPIVQSVTKYAAFVREPSSIRQHLERAVRLATTGRPGPVLLDLPLDVQGALIEPDDLPASSDECPSKPAVDGEAIETAIRHLRSARRPLILAGQGVRLSGAAELFEAAAGIIGTPLVTTQMAKDLVPHDHPLFVGHPGHKGDRAANFAVQTADCLLSIGCSLHIQTTGYERDQFAPNAIKIQVEIDPGLRARENAGFTHKIAMDAGLFLAELNARWPRAACDKSSWEGWVGRCLEWKSTFAAANEPHETLPPECPANLYEFVDVLSDALLGNETLVLDAGQSYYVVPQALRLRRGQRYIVAGALGAMGIAVPFSIGAAVARPNSAVICVTGDGSFQLNAQELQTIRHYGLNVKLFVIENGGYASIRATQRNFFNGHFVGATQESGVSLAPIPGLAAAYGLPCIESPNRRTLRDAVGRAIGTPGPVVCSISTLHDQLILPSVPSYRSPDGRMRSRALHQMTPPLPESVLRETLAI